MKRASYRHAVEVIALNDEPCELSADVMAGFASVMIIAEIFGIDQERVARDVVRLRSPSPHRSRSVNITEE
jgi:hypothetical protein